MPLAAADPNQEQYHVNVSNFYGYKLDPLLLLHLLCPFSDASVDLFKDGS